MGDGKEIAPAPAPAAVERERGGTFITDGLVKQLQAQVQLIKAYRLALLQLTSEEHWIDQAGRPYLESDGVHLLAACIGVEFSAPEIAEDNHASDPEPWIGYTCRLSASFRGRSVSEIGYASTRDDFLASAGKGQGLLPLEQVDRGNIQKKAVTNAQSRAFSKVTGLGAVTWEELTRAGVKQGRRVDYRGSGEGRGAAQGAGTWTPEKDDLWKKMCEMCGGSDAAAQALEDLTANPDRGFKGIRDLKAASDRQVQYLKGKILAEWRKFTAGPDGPAAEKREPGAEG